jgi:hypothetical protein
MNVLSWEAFIYCTGASLSLFTHLSCFTLSDGGDHALLIVDPNAKPKLRLQRAFDTFIVPLQLHHVPISQPPDSPVVLEICGQAAQPEKASMNKRRSSTQSTWYGIRSSHPSSPTHPRPVYAGNKYTPSLPFASSFMHSGDGAFLWKFLAF